MSGDQVLDLRGLNCPQHVMRCKAALMRAAAGQVLRVRMTDSTCRYDIPLLVDSLGDQIEAISDNGRVTEITIRCGNRHAVDRRYITPSPRAATDRVG